MGVTQCSAPAHLQVSVNELQPGVFVAAPNVGGAHPRFKPPRTASGLVSSRLQGQQHTRDVANPTHIASTCCWPACCRPKVTPDCSHFPSREDLTFWGLCRLPQHSSSHKKVQARMPAAAGLVYLPTVTCTHSRAAGTPSWPAKAVPRSALRHRQLYTTDQRPPECQRGRWPLLPRLVGFVICSSNGQQQQQEELRSTMRAGSCFI